MQAEERVDEDERLVRQLRMGIIIFVEAFYALYISNAVRTEKVFIYCFCGD